MSWLYVDSSKVRFVLDARRDLLGKAYRNADGSIGYYTRADLHQIHTILGEHSGGSFGGGGSTGEVPPEGGAEWIPIIVGDQGCPPSGLKKTWRFLTRDEAGLEKVYGPHVNGPFTNFYGLELVNDWWSTPPSHAVWVPADNAAACGALTPFPFPPGVPPACSESTGTGVCALPDPTTQPYYTVWVERFANWEGRSPPVGEVYQMVPVNMGNAWEIAQVSCEPPHRGWMPIKPDIDRPRVPKSKTEKVRENDLDIPLVVPPFVFGAVMGGPSGLPSLSEGGFRGRKPPRSRTRESKQKGKLQTLLKVLDVVSEASEVVDCFYQALPRATRKRWEKDRPNRGLLDQAGQYGIDGADWKGQAIWHNHKSLKWSDAIECVAYNNLIEDKLVGALNRAIPKGAGTAISREVARQRYLEERDRQRKKWAEIRAANAARIRH